MPRDEFNTTVGAALRAHRLAKGLTQQSTATLAGLSPNYIARLERGELCPSLRVAHQLCRALGIKVDTVLEAA